MPTFADNKVRPEFCVRDGRSMKEQKLKTGIRAVTRLLPIRENRSVDTHAHRAVNWGVR